jgi:hypothetical protein
MFASSGIIDNITDSPFFSVDVAITGCNIRGMLNCFPFHQTSVPASFLGDVVLGDVVLGFAFSLSPVLGFILGFSLCPGSRNVCTIFGGG